MIRSISKKTLGAIFLLSCLVASSFPAPSRAEGLGLICSASTQKASPIRYSNDKNPPPSPETADLVFEDTPLYATLTHSKTSATNLTVRVVQEESQIFYGYWFDKKPTDTSTETTATIYWNAGDTNNGSYKMELWGDINGSNQLLCAVPSVFEVQNTGSVPLKASCDTLQVAETEITDQTTTLHASYDTNTLPQSGNTVRIVFQGNADAYITDNYQKGLGVVNESFPVTIANLKEIGTLKQGVIALEQFSGNGTWKRVCEKMITYDTTKNTGTIETPTPDNGTKANDQQGIDLCKQAGANAGTCKQCFDKQGIWTGIGCIPYNDTTQTVRALITVGLGLAGTVVVLMTLAGAFMLSTSKGDPTKVQEAKSLIFSAVSGILFLIFSVSILRFIGVSVLQIPGFG